MKNRLVLKEWEEIYRIVNGTTYIIQNPHTEFDNFYDWNVRMYTKDDHLFTKCVAFGQKFKDKEQLKDTIDEYIASQFYEASYESAMIGMKGGHACDPTDCKYIKQLEGALEWACEELQNMCLIVHKDDYSEVTTPISMGQWLEEAIKHGK